MNFIPRLEQIIAKIPQRYRNPSAPTPSKKDRKEDLQRKKSFQEKQKREQEEARKKRADKRGSSTRISEMEDKVNDEDGKTIDLKKGDDGKFTPSTNPQDGFKVVRDGDKKEEDEGDEVEDSDVKDDAGTLTRANSLGRILSMKDPHFMLANFKGNLDWKKEFFSSADATLKNERLVVPFYKGKGNNLDEVYGWFIQDSIRGSMEGWLGKTPAAFYKLPKNYFSEDRPFQNLELSNAFKAELQGTETLLINQLNDLWDALKAAAPQQGAGQVSAIQLHNEIPVNYLRFLSQKQVPRKFYYGGQPPNAGSPDFIYALAKEQEIGRFLKLMQRFKQKDNFYKDLFSLSDIDPDFKDYPPEKLLPANAIIVSARKRFNPKAKIGEKTELEIMTDFARDVLKAVPPPGTYVNGRLIVGNRFVHFNKNFTQAILWGSVRNHLKVTKEQVLAALPFVKDVDLNYI